MSTWRWIPLVCLLSGCATQLMPPEVFTVVGDATLTVEGELELRGRFEGEYALEKKWRAPGLEYRELQLRRLRTWLHDLDVVVPRIGRDRVIPLRCTSVAADGRADGLVETGSGAIRLRAGKLAFYGVSYEQRADDGGCPGQGGVVVFRGDNNKPLSGRHDPLGNEFELEGRFELEVDSESYRGRLRLDGHFLNRPPLARIASIAPPLFDLSQGGCPPLTGRNPAGVDSNSPEGLRMVLQSVSSDADGDLRRADLTLEQWAHFVGRPGDPGSRYEFLGRGRRIGPVLFEADREHTVILGVSDRGGARHEDRCVFFVRRP